MNIKKILPTIILCAATWLYFSSAKPNHSAPDISLPAQTQTIPPTNFEHVLQQAFQNHQSNLQISGSGIVQKTLPDDKKGSRHQRFILKLNSGQTLLVAHNIDLAAKIKGLKKGDTVEFYGEYEWSEQGGVIHWTHHDPAKRHADGWLKHNGQIYQ
ncbi:DUF3465 domain-containing protein [Neisseriaceae bacterium B1]